MEQQYTQRGFGFVEFTDLYGATVELQQSSLATEKAVWLGPSNADPKIMASKTAEGGTGWVPFSIPEEVSLTTRAHLSRSMVEDLVLMLQSWLDSGNFVSSCSEQGEKNSNSSPSGPTTSKAKNG